MTLEREARPGERLFWLIPGGRDAAAGRTRMRSPDRRSYWLDAFTLKGSVTPHVTSIVATFGILSMGICSISWLAERTVGHRLALQDAP
jgi:hypothetical protein